MRWLLLFAASAASLYAQLSAPNEAGVSMGYVRLLMHEPQQQIKLWTDVFGATPGKAGPFQLFKIPGLVVIVSHSEADGAGTEGSAVNHIGIAVKDYPAIKAKLRQAKVAIKEQKSSNRKMVATFPGAVLVEIIEDKNLSVPVAFHHFHVSGVDPEAERDWYVKYLAAMSTSRLDMPAAAFPGGEIDFMKSDVPQASTKGRVLIHIGFEVKNLEAFCKNLKAQGLTFVVEYRDLDKYGLQVASLMDPAGTSVELMEGLTGK